MWTCAIGGGHYVFHDDADQGTPTTGIMGYDRQVVGGVKPFETYDWLGHLSRFFNEMVPELDTLAPRNELVVSGTAYCLAQPGRVYVCYLPEGGAIGLKVAGNGPVTVRWYDPRTGAVQEVDNPPAIAEGQLRLKAPSEADWVVLVEGK